MKYLVKQAILVPALYFIPILIAGLLVPDYDMVKQHASEITLTHYKNAVLIFNSGMLLSGLSCILLALGIIFNLRKIYISSIILIIFGISMVSNGIFPMGNVMHGFYGIGLTIMLLPFAACYELKNENVKKIFFRISIISAIVVFVYFWSMIVHLQPENYSGLLQRIIATLIFGWIAYFGFVLDKNVA